MTSLHDKVCYIMRNYTHKALMYSVEKTYLQKKITDDRAEVILNLGKKIRTQSYRSSFVLKMSLVKRSVELLYSW